MSELLLSSAAPLVEAYDLGLVDLDGVTYAGHDPIAHAADGLALARRAGMRLVFVTNNASREPGSVSDQLSSLGIPAASDDVMTAAQACATLLGDHVAPGSRVLVVGGAGLVTAVTEAGYVVVTSAEDQPAAVAQGFSPGLSWGDLAEAAYAVAGGAVHVASNLDLSLPTARGFAPGNGALVGAVSAATGVKPFSAGKPAPTMYAMAVARAGAERPLVIGDRLDTDLAGARAGGYPGFHVLTGVSSARDDVLAAPGERPHFIGADLRSLTLAHDAPVLGESGWWTCGASSARVVDGKLEVVVDEAEQDPVNVVRASCNAAWTFVDAGGVLQTESVPEFAV
ncbi:HAD-IIA family hydrolase [Sanguibacter antarcticus]|uniref:HAD superfamily hydrolase (TIGR01450 family) n=1 Tax=Sanguibacter antarcticus TaxID=372484 RepID=A0A2A9E5G5_9MICO|nr:HAD hydrolase-like protein [Sanguibacter antarcticus]PFG33409.1 HAD superfamily hydrolase (TIGR01450 family) [Sanguibacter antarcticus]